MEKVEKQSIINLRFDKNNINFIQYLLLVNLNAIV
jgi:hypothetical protein